MKVSIIIPAHNEQRRIGKTLKVYSEYFEKLRKERILDYEIIVSINATTDKTKDIVKSFQKSNKRILYLDLIQGGKGHAIIEGFKLALKDKRELIGFVDADLATPPEAFHDLIKNIGDYDGVIASRWLKGSIIRTKQTLLRKITSNGFNFVVRSMLFLPYADTQCGAKLFKKDTIAKVINGLNITKWAFDIDLLYNIKREKLNIKEIPTIWEDKKESKLNLIVVPFQMFIAVLRIRLLHSPFGFVIKAYDHLPESLKIHHRFN